VLRKNGCPQAGESLFLSDVPDEEPWTLCPGHLPDESRDALLFGVTGDDANAGNSGDIRRGPLGVAAGYEDRRGRILPDSPTDELPGLVVAPLGHRAGIDDVAVRLFLERDDRHPPGSHRLGYPGGFALVDLAAEGRYGDPENVSILGDFSRRWAVGYGRFLRPRRLVSQLLPPVAVVVFPRVPNLSARCSICQGERNRAIFS